MIEISIDQLVPNTLMSLATGEVFEAMLTNIATAAEAKWGALASQNLSGQSRETYLKGIQPIEVEVGSRVITLVGWLANAIEQGQDPYDMRDTLLGPKSSLRRKAAGGGYYGHVPFRHGTPGTAGMAGTPMGRQYGPTGPASRAVGDRMTTQDAASMGKRIHKAAMRLEETIQKGPGGKTEWGGRLPKGMAPKLLPSQLQRPTGINIHKTDIFAGMVRTRHVYEASTDPMYMTWRTISSKNPEGWHHPGIEARHLAEQVRDYVIEVAPKIIRAAIGGALK
jgi:hypothetical protein